MNSTLVATRYRLISGYHLLPSSGSWVLFRPDGRFVRLKVRPDLCEALAFTLSDASSVRLTPEPPAQEIDALLAQFIAEGIVVAEEPGAEDDNTEDHRSPQGTKPFGVVVLGDDAIAERLSELLSAEGFETAQEAPGNFERLDDVAAELSAGVLVHGAGWLQDRRFQATDTWCKVHGMAWHGYYAEGDRLHLGPFWIPGDSWTAPYADTRARQLAASVYPEGLEDYWRYLEAGERVAPFEPLLHSEAALAAGTLAADILAHANRTQPPSHGHQLAYHRPTGRWQRHPVLPVPRGLLTEEIP